MSNLKQWLIKQFGSKEFVESRMVSTCVPQEPVVGELAQQLAEAIRTGKIILEAEEQLLSSVRYKEINGVTFVRNVTGIDCNGVFNPDEQRYLLAAHKDWQEEQKRCKRITTEKQIKNLLSSIDKQET